MDILCTVDIATREVSLPEEYVIASYDHLVDVIHFYIEPIEDFSLDTSSIRIAAKGPDGEQHDYAVDANTVAVEEETGYITFDWPIPMGVTAMPLDTFSYGNTGKLIFAVCAEIISGTTITQAWHSDDGVITVVAHLEPENDGESSEETATNAEMIAALQTDMAALEAAMAALGSVYPTAVSTAAEMTDSDTIYLYTGSEDGYSTGYWYYYDGSAWTAGGEYGGAVLDDTLTQDVAAQAAAVGTALGLKANASDICTDFDATATYALGDYVLYNNDLYMCTTAVETAGAWDASYWTAITAMQDLGARLDKLVTYQLVEEEEETVEGIVQIIDPSKLTWSGSGSRNCTAKFSEMIPLKGDGEYWQNPCGVSINDMGKWYFYYANFYDAYGNKLTLTRESDSSTSQYVTLWGSADNNGHFEIENGRTLHHYFANALTATYTTTADIAYLGYGQPQFAYFDNYTTNFGITYGGSSSSYVAYEGSETEPTYEYQYVPAMAAYVEEYMQSRGTAASNNLFNYFYPEADDSTFANLVKYYEERLRRKADDVIRIASFNKYVSRGSSNWDTIKQELADCAVDICGFQECDFSSTSRIETALQGIQFPYGSDHENSNTGKAIVSHWEITSTTVLELLTTGRGVSYALNSKIKLYPYNMYSNVIDNECTLSVYDYHGIAYNTTVDGTSYTSQQIREMEINALLAIVAQDTSDFIVIVGDTNAFETGYDIATGTHAEWELFRDAGFTPVLPGYESTVTADADVKYFTLADNGKVYCICCYDQIFIGSNISVEGYEVVDSNLYPVASLSNAPVSDHCMIYADLKFDFDAVMQSKLAEIAVTEPWW